MRASLATVLIVVFASAGYPQTTNGDRELPNFKVQAWGYIVADFSTRPTLPDDIQYRFLGHHLVLLDIRANVILDRIPCAIECKE